ncbi:MAG: hypothetical protein ACQESG_06070 [Nanobdellota archaeon]
MDIHALHAQVPVDAFILSKPYAYLKAQLVDGRDDLSCETGDPLQVRGTEYQSLLIRKNFEDPVGLVQGYSTLETLIGYHNLNLQDAHIMAFTAGVMSPWEVALMLRSDYHCASFEGDYLLEAEIRLPGDTDSFAQIPEGVAYASSQHVTMHCAFEYQTQWKERHSDKYPFMLFTKQWTEYVPDPEERVIAVYEDLKERRSPVVSGECRVKALQFFAYDDEYMVRATSERSERC